MYIYIYWQLSSDTRKIIAINTLVCITEFLIDFKTIVNI